MLSWRSAFTDFVQQNPANTTILDNILEENISKVIYSLGGLSNVIQLCLANPNASKYIDKDKFQSFETIMRENGISFDNLDELPNNENKSNNTEIVIVHDNDNIETQTSPTRVTMVDTTERQMSDEIFDNSYIKYIRQFKANNTDNTKTIENKWIAIVDNLSEYYKSRLIPTIKSKEKIIFQWFGVGGYIEKLIASKMFLYSLPLLAILGLTIAFILWTIDGPNLSYFATMTGTFLIADFFATIHFLNAHKLLYSLIFNTFDFWFMLWNGINGSIARLALGVYHESFVWYTIARAVTFVYVVVALACGDAAHVPKQSKAIISAVVVMCYSFIGLKFYFQGKDVTWNPFESYGIKEANISFKSVYLSSLTNIVLFSSKYWFKDIYSLLHKLIKVYVCTTVNGSDENDMSTIHSNSHDDTNVNYANCARCVSLYTRPYVQWQ